MIRGMTLLWGALAIMVGIGLFLLKFQVQSLEDELASLNRKIRNDRQEIHILRAEWAYLNDPARIRALAQRHLGMEVVPSTQVVAMETLPVRPARPADLVIPVAAEGTPAQAPWKSYPIRKPILELASVRAQ